MPRPADFPAWFDAIHPVYLPMQKRSSPVTKCRNGPKVMGLRRRRFDEAVSNGPFLPLLKAVPCRNRAWYAPPTSSRSTSVMRSPAPSGLSLPSNLDGSIGSMRSPSSTRSGVGWYGNAMAKRPHRTVLFLCTGNYFRSRFAEILFNHVAAKFGLLWKASSRALAPEPATRNVGPMAVVAIKALERMGIRASADFARLPQEVITDELDQAHLIVALKHTEHLPMLQERFSAWVERVEFWDVDDDPKVLGLMEREVAELIARLIVEGKGGDSPVQPWKEWAIE